jgi:hypothetical protein
VRQFGRHQNHDPEEEEDTLKLDFVESVFFFPFSQNPKRCISKAWKNFNLIP